MAAPTSIADAKARIVQEKNALVSGVQAVVGSRTLLAVLSIFMIGFGAQSLLDPNYLPPFGNLNFTTFGLPEVNFGAAGNFARDARNAAINHGAPEWLASYLRAHRDIVPYFNYGGFAGCALMLLANLAAAAQKWKSPAALNVRVGVPT